MLYKEKTIVKTIYRLRFKILICLNYANPLYLWGEFGILEELEKQWPGIGQNG